MTAELATRVVLADAAAILQAARTLASGGLVAFPTETVYGLGADATNATAIARLYAAKGRPSFNPLIAHVTSVAAARVLAAFDTAAEKLAAKFWPGPLTLVLRKRPDCPVAELATAGLDTIAVRVPDHPIPLALLKAVGVPLATTSVNRSGQPPATSGPAAHKLFGTKVEWVIDGGTCHIQEASSVVDLSSYPFTVIREGAIAKSQLEHVLLMKKGK